MRVLIDTNVLISAALSANGTPYQAYVKAASYPNHGLICEQNVDEMKRIFNKKFPNRLAAQIAVETVRAYRQEQTNPMEVIFNVFRDQDHAIYRQLLG